MNAVVFHASDYCHSHSAAPTCDPTSLAITWVYNVNHPGQVDDGRLLEADVEINGESERWSLGGDPANHIMDLQSALTHELGHVLGLDHVCYVTGHGLPRPVDDAGKPLPDCTAADANVTASVMFPVSTYEVPRRTISADDVRGVCAIYPPGTPTSCQGSLNSASGCAVAGDPPASGWAVIAGLISLVARGRGRRRALAACLWGASAAACSSGTPQRTPCVGQPRTGEVCVAGGVFTMGHAAIPDPRRVPLAQLQTPAHRVELPPFFIDARPVTNAEYLTCLQAVVCPDECQAAGTMSSVGVAGCGGQPFYNAYHLRDPNLATSPVATIFDVGAEAYCKWVGKRLPTEAEWERAARGPGDGDYPWGDAAPDCSRYGCDLKPLDDDPSKPFTPVGAHPVDGVTGDVTSEGVRFMVTGVAEFLHDWYYDYPFDDGQPIPSPQGSPAAGIGQSARGNMLTLLPLYRGHVSLPPDQAIEPFPQPAWARASVGWINVAGVRCARDDVK